MKRRMRVSHAYRPVMLPALLRGGGRCSVEEVARAILSRDRSQVEYYETIINIAVGRVLRYRGIMGPRQLPLSPQSAHGVSVPSRAPFRAGSRLRPLRGPATAGKICSRHIPEEAP